MEVNKNMLEILMKDINEIKVNQEKYEDIIEEVLREKEEIANKIKILEDKTAMIEKDKKKNDLIITGIIRDNEDQLKDKRKNIIKEELQVDSQIRKEKKNLETKE